MSTGLVHSLLDAQPSTPAGEPPLKVVMIDRKNIIVNPDNHKIYVIGDVSRLKEDIKTNGIRQPLEVVDLEDGNYKLIGGERRLTACEELAREGDTRFNALPCVILKLKNDDDDKIALITANATARELTDGERLAQYEALKEILTRRKKNGQLEGKVRDELCRILGLSAGAAARLNAISENCDPSTIHQMRIGNITFTGAYKRAQEIIEAKKPPVEPPKQEKMVYKKPVVFDCPPKAAETIPQNPDYDEWNLPPECRVAVEKAHREAAQKQEEQQRGNLNSGNRNSGNRNSGDWNVTSFSNGCFNTVSPKIYMFNKPSDWTLQNWFDSSARYLLNQIDDCPIEYVRLDRMTDEEKAAHPETETTGGYLKKRTIADNAQKWWEGLSADDRNIIFSLPNFDPAIFKEITGIEVTEKA